MVRAQVKSSTTLSHQDFSVGNGLLSHEGLQPSKPLSVLRQGQEEQRRKKYKGVEKKRMSRRSKRDDGRRERMEERKTPRKEDHALRDCEVHPGALVFSFPLGRNGAQLIWGLLPG